MSSCDLLLLISVDDVMRVVYVAFTACVYSLELYDFLTLLLLWLLVCHCSRLGEELDDDDARVDVDAEE